MPRVSKLIRTLARAPDMSRLQEMDRSGGGIATREDATMERRVNSRFCTGLRRSYEVGPRSFEASNRHAPSSHSAALPAARACAAILSLSAALSNEAVFSSPAVFPHPAIFPYQAVLAYATAFSPASPRPYEATLTAALATTPQTL
ncbi:uncharacterized protein K452DRAFT_294379 [Aplosporella prunicola CBS 121167]|uniref:Uncharacterized protein n=1 Tax=Aplosporella prunicola CBS 121167 TaxID=1176127 RepID=A0A6A6BST5_9PEZI|nr:uncharacterized protein K452DRAFT_294379 [Aplosporella prunicola CBS 121167]KAF2146848.1 hypothetical protein K452DRAFT_294379 [Aplosporella prunicola CBS 121167]